MKKLFKEKKIILPAFFVLFLLTLMLIGYEIALNYSFSGIVQKVNYNEKGIPTITIKGKDYELGYNDWGSTNDTIKVGDSVIKTKGQLHIKLMKRNRNDQWISK